MSRRFRGVDVLAAAAEELDRLFVWRVGKPDGEEGLALAEHAWATAEVGFLVLFKLRCNQLGN